MVFNNTFTLVVGPKKSALLPFTIGKQLFLQAMVQFESTATLLLCCKTGITGNNFQYIEWHLHDSIHVWGAILEQFHQWSWIQLIEYICISCYPTSITEFYSIIHHWILIVHVHEIYFHSFYLQSIVLFPLCSLFI